MEAVVLTGLLVFVRLATVISGLPIFGSLGAPRQAVLVASMLCALIVTPHVAAVEVPRSLGQLVLAVGLEILYGYAMTLGVRMVFGAVALAGELMGMQVGLALATLFDPLSRESSSALGTLATWLAGMVFLGTNLHLVVIEVVAKSFAVSPPGLLRGGDGLGSWLIGAMGTHFSLGLQLAGPTIALIFVLNVLMALLTRLAPRMNVFFALGLTASSVGGMWLLWGSLPWFLAEHRDAMRRIVAGFAEQMGV